MNKMILAATFILGVTSVSHAQSDKINDAIQGSIGIIEIVAGTKMVKKVVDGLVTASFDGRTFLTAPELLAYGKISLSLRDLKFSKADAKKWLTPRSVKPGGLKNFSEDGSSTLISEVARIDIKLDGTKMTVNANGGGTRINLLIRILLQTDGDEIRLQNMPD